LGLRSVCGPIALLPNVLHETELNTAWLNDAVAGNHDPILELGYPPGAPRPFALAHDLTPADGGALR